jgi:hypothetical protein
MLNHWEKFYCGGIKYTAQIIVFLKSLEGFMFFNVGGKANMNICFCTCIKNER